VQEGGTKRKRGAGEKESSARVTKKVQPERAWVESEEEKETQDVQPPDMMKNLYVEGREWYYGTNFKYDGIRGQVMIEAAATSGVAFAEAECIYMGWGGREEDVNKAFEMFMKLAGEGKDESFALIGHLIGSCYEHGKGVEKDLVKAFEWYTKAAEKGDSIAMWKLSVCYEYGYGVVKNLSKRFEWMKKASECGHQVWNSSLTCQRHSSG